MRSFVVSVLKQSEWTGRFAPGRSSSFLPGFEASSFFFFCRVTSDRVLCSSFAGLNCSTQRWTFPVIGESTLHLHMRPHELCKVTPFFSRVSDFRGIKIRAATIVKALCFQECLFVAKFGCVFFFRCSLFVGKWVKFGTCCFYGTLKFGILRGYEWFYITHFGVFLIHVLKLGCYRAFVRFSGGQNNQNQ